MAPLPVLTRPESKTWPDRLRADGPEREAAIGELHELLLRAARFELGRRRVSVSHLRGDDYDDLAHQCADDALVAVLGKLDDFRGESRFTTWAYKFALFEAAVKVRRRAWQGREVPLEDEAWTRLAARESRPADGQADARDALAALPEAIAETLSQRQREVLVAVALNGVPIDVLAERLETTRGALYKSLHDARRKLRAALAQRGFDVVGLEGEVKR
ncbi:MAG TPA: RNA polymerase sigma factor [Solirubrobacterales bacterium]|nr:RNA polymerase sigma factor [Solirubrobacterales bacterium]